MGFTDVEFRKLDISDENSIKSFCAQMSHDYQSIDVLVNNAAIAFKGSDPTPFKEQARPTVTTNYFGTLAITKELIPLLKNSPSPRIVNVASESGHLNIIKSSELRRLFSSEKLSHDELNGLMKQFISDVENGIHVQNGWPNSCYGTSKLGVIAYTKILAREFEGTPFRINSCCPGYCQTDMSSHRGNKSAREGAETPAYLAMALSDDGPTGKFFSEKKEIIW